MADRLRQRLHPAPQRRAVAAVAGRRGRRQRGWDVGSPEQPRRVFKFDGARAAGTIRFDNEFGHDCSPAGRRSPTSLAYAQQESGKHNVSDVKLSLVYDRKAGDGPLRLRLTKRATRSPPSSRAARREAVPRPRHRGGAGRPRRGDRVRRASPAVLAAAAPVRLDFINVDYRVTLRVGGEDVLHIAYDPDIAALLPAYAPQGPAQAGGARSRRRPVVRAVAREPVADVYYTNSRQRHPLGARRTARSRSAPTSTSCSATTR